SETRGSEKAVRAVGRRSSEPAKAPMNVGNSTAGCWGYSRQSPALSMKARAASMVWTALPSMRHCLLRCCWSSKSVIKEAVSYQQKIQKPSLRGHKFLAPHDLAES